MADPKAEPATEERFRNRIVGLEYVNAGELLPHPKNWRLHPDDQRSAMTSALESIGVAGAAIAYKSKRAGDRLVLIDGHLRRELADGQVPVLVTDLDDVEADALLASYDVITTMAVPDEAQLSALLDDLEMELPRDLMVAIDPDLERYDEFELPEGAAAKYEIVPQLDEGYDFVVIFCTREVDYAWLRTVLELPVKRDRKKIGISHVLTVNEFRELWSGRSSSPIDEPAE